MDPATAMPKWVKLGDLKAGDTVELHGFDCASGTVTLEQDPSGELFFRCAQGRHYVNGQLDADGNLVGIAIRPATQMCIHNLPIYMHCEQCERDLHNVGTTIPLTQEYPSMNLNTDDANSVSRFFQSLADKVVLASTLPAEVAELREVVERLKADVESYREHMARADEEISNLRRERQALQDENATLRERLVTSENERMVAETRWNQACSERDRWHQDYITASTGLEDIKRERDDAQMKIMELEDTTRRMADDHEHVLRERDELFAKLSSIRSALA